MSWVIETAVAPRSLHAFDDQVVDHVGHDRVEAGGRLVEEDDLRLAGDGAGQRHALLHAAGEFGGKQLADLGPEADGAQLGAAPLRAPGRGFMPSLWIRPKATFSQTGSESNSAPPWNSMPNLRMTRGAARGRRRRRSPRRRPGSSRASGAHQAEDAFQQHRLAGARAADHDQRFARAPRRDRCPAAPSSGRRPWRRRAARSWRRRRHRAKKASVMK